MMSNMEIFEHLESEVRAYIRTFPIEFMTAHNTTVVAVDGSEYLDFFAGAGALNYGHNNPVLKQAIIEYLENDGIIHSLDLATTAKREFIEVFDRLILQPRGLDYKFQFTGPTGTNAVEAALKLARQVGGRPNVVAFTNGFHGVSVGSLAATGNEKLRYAAGFPLSMVTHMPFDGYLGKEFDTLDYFERMLRDPSSGLDTPAAVIVEAVQGEGGVNAASVSWLRRLRELTARYGILLILDEIQAGIGRTGPFFAFEVAGIVPDMVTLSKSLSAYGLPMAMLLLGRDLDKWDPGAHSGTFRGNNLAFIAARVALEKYWANDSFEKDVERKAQILDQGMQALIAAFPQHGLQSRGRGFMRGLTAPNDLGWARGVAERAFDRRLLIETAGPRGEVLKFLAALTIEESELIRGLEVLGDAILALGRD